MLKLNPNSIRKWGDTGFPIPLLAAFAIVIGAIGAPRGLATDLAYPRIDTQMERVEIDAAIALGGLEALERIEKASRLRDIYDAMLKNERERIALRRSMANRRAAAQLAANARTTRSAANIASTMEGNRRRNQTTNEQGKDEAQTVTLIRPRKMSLRIPDGRNAEPNSSPAIAALEEPLVIGQPPSSHLHSASASPNTRIAVAQESDVRSRSHQSESHRSAMRNNGGTLAHKPAPRDGSATKTDPVAPPKQPSLEPVKIDESLMAMETKVPAPDPIEKTPRELPVKRTLTEPDASSLSLSQPPTLPQPPTVPEPTVAYAKAESATRGDGAPAVFVAQVPLTRIGRPGNSRVPAPAGHDASSDAVLGLADLMAATPAGAIEAPGSSGHVVRLSDTPDPTETQMRQPANARVQTQAILSSVRKPRVTRINPSPPSRPFVADNTDVTQDQSPASRNQLAPPVVQPARKVATARKIETARNVEAAAPQHALATQQSDAEPQRSRSKESNSQLNLAWQRYRNSLAAQRSESPQRSGLATAQLEDISSAPSVRAIATEDPTLDSSNAPSGPSSSAPSRAPIVTRFTDGLGQELVLQPAHTDQEAKAAVAAGADRPRGDRQGVAGSGPHARVAAQWPFTLGKQPLPAPAGNDVTLSVDDVDVRTVLEMLAKGYGMNILVAPDVTGTVTATVSELSPEQTLRSVARMCGLAIENQDNVILVYPKDNVPRESRELRVFPLDFARAELVEPTVTGLLSPVGSAYSSQVDELDNRKGREAIVVIDTPDVLAQVERYLLQADQPPRQVMIEARVLEIELKDDMEHGVNWEWLAGGDLTLGGAFITQNIATPANPFFFGEIDGTQLDALLTLLETTTDAKTLATPRVMVVNGQNAKIQVGQQLGFAVATVTQTSTIQDVRYLDTGIVLQVTPTISRDNRILMQVKPKVSSGEINPDTLLPEETTREIETSVMLDNHQGMIIGGLIQENDSVLIRKLPWLGDVKYVGKLFQRREAKRSRTEVVITLIPHIMDSCENGHCSVNDPMRDQTEWERTESRLFNGPLNRECRPWEARLPDVTGETWFHRDIDRQRNRNPYGKGCEPIKTGLFHPH